MKSTTLRLILVAASILFCVGPASAQRFGKNKVTYERFDWHVYRSPHFDIHYYPSVEPFLDQLVSYAESAYAQLNKSLDHELRFRVPLVVYKTHGEFLQTNITLSELPEFVAAFSEPVPKPEKWVSSPKRTCRRWRFPETFRCWNGGGNC